MSISLNLKQIVRAAPGACFSVVGLPFLASPIHVSMLIPAVLAVFPLAAISFFRKAQASKIDLFQFGGDAVLVLDHEGTILQANEASSKILGIDATHLSDRPFSEL